MPSPSMTVGGDPIRPDITDELHRWTQTFAVSHPSHTRFNHAGRSWGHRWSPDGGSTLHNATPHRHLHRPSSCSPQLPTQPDRRHHVTATNEGMGATLTVNPEVHVASTRRGHRCQCRRSHRRLIIGRAWGSGIPVDRHRRPLTQRGHRWAPPLSWPAWLPRIAARTSTAGRNRPWAVPTPTAVGA